MILKRLKSATARQHEELEGLVKVMSPGFGLEDYVPLLAKFYRFYLAYEPALPLNELLEWHLDYEQRRKLPLLTDDLAKLGCDLALVKPFGGAPDVSDVACALGSLYVVEGSTLGGQIISRHIKTSLGVEPGRGGSFFAAYGDAVGPRWKEFGAVVTRFSERNDADDAIVDAAVKTFESVRDCLLERVAASYRAAPASAVS